jgi:hypothetical protein
MGILKTFENGQWIPIAVGETGATGPQGATGPGVDFSAIGNTQVLINIDGAAAGDSTLTFDPATDTLTVNNITLSGANATSRIGTTATYNQSGTQNPDRIMLGNGDATNTSDPLLWLRYSRVAVNGQHEQSDNGKRSVSLAVQQLVTPSQDLNNNNTRLTAAANILALGGGADNYNYNQNSPLAVATSIQTLTVGGALGNTSIARAAGVTSATIMSAGSDADTLANFQASPINQGGEIVNVFGLRMDALGAGAPAERVAVVYNPVFQPNWIRQSSQYNFVRNDDPAAHSEIGALSVYSERAGEAFVTDGAIEIDKFNGAAQFAFVDQDITDIQFFEYENNLFVDVGSSGDPWEGWRFDIDTVTLWVDGGGTHTVTLPATNSQGVTLKYANGVNEFVTSEGSTHLVTISLSANAFIDDFDNLQVSYTGLVTVSPEFQ